MRMILLSILGAVFLAGGFTLYSLYYYRTPRSYPAQTLIIPPYSGGRAVLAQLHEAQLVPSLPVVAIPLMLSGNKGKLKAGEYDIPQGLSAANIIDKIARGEIVLHRISIPEGWNRFQVQAALAAEPLLTGPIPDFAEGSIFPDTINFTRNESRAAVLARMQKPQQAILAELWQTRAPNLPFATPEQALILASIIEKETGVIDERALVSSVFINRLLVGQALETDPTVIYGLVAAHGGVALNHPLTLAELRTDTSYNTYMHTGLPPTPICNPGKAALFAALHPAQSDALYFVATGHGGHRFAATLAEHLKNVAAYRAAMRAPGQ